MEIQIFNNPQFGEIRTTGTSEQPLFCLADLCRVLDLKTKFVNQRLEKGVVSNHPLETNGGIQQALFVNEDGLYDVILDSRKPEAKAFRKWVTSEVLPAIRKSGGYMVSTPEETPEEIMARALLVANDTIERNKKKLELVEKKNERLEHRVQTQDGMLEARSNHIKQLLPAATFAHAVKTSDRSILIGELARIIKQNGVEIGQNRLFVWMRERGYLIKTTESYNQPTQKSMNMGLFEIKKTAITKPDGTTLVTTTTKVTGKGQIYFVNKFLYEIINSEDLELLRTGNEQHEAMKGGEL